MQDEPESHDEVAGSSDGATGEREDAHDFTNELELAKTTLVEVSPGMAVVLGQVPEGLQLVDFGVVPAIDRAQLNQALGSVGNLATISGNLAEAATKAQGLFRVDDATLSLRSEEHTSELQSRFDLVCRLLPVKKNYNY